MIRIVHRWPGLILALLLLVISISGAILAAFPAIDSLKAVSAESGLSVADLAHRVSLSHPGLEEIRRGPSGQITAWWFDAERPGSSVIDPATGLDLGSADPDPVRRWITSLHRSLLLDDTGRLMTALGAFTMLLLCITGAFLVARRLGGWRGWFGRLNGPMSGRLHTEIARIAVIGLILSCVTGLWMAGETFDVIVVEPTSVDTSVDTPAAVSARPAMPLSAMAALRDVPVSALHELGFPDPTDPLDVFSLTTSSGMGYVDTRTGLLIAWHEHGLMQRLSQTITILHTGQGAAWLGLILGLMALSVPVLALTGFQVWLSRRRAEADMRQRSGRQDNAAPGLAQTVILVGSESGTTWGFAGELARALREAGQAVFVAAMNDFAPRQYRSVQQFILLAATYGQGDAPASAHRFLDLLSKLRQPPSAPVAILGFGDRGFERFCDYARQVQDAATRLGWSGLLPYDTIDRQSAQAFTRWGKMLGERLGIDLALNHQAEVPATRMLTLIGRRDFGEKVNAPMTILRFKIPAASCWQKLTCRTWAPFEAGDLMGIIPSGSEMARLYSLASSAQDGFIEVVVRKHPYGLASGQLTSLQPGEQVRAFLRPHPAFHAGDGDTPLILIGAGTGVGPLAGFVRANHRRRPMHLFFGVRNRSSDFLYESEIAQWLQDGRLSGLHLAQSRSDPSQYVQDSLREEATLVTSLILQGARVMVCGSTQMAHGVRQAISDLLIPESLSLSMLIKGGHYVEDIY